MNARLQQRLERLEAAVLDRTRQAEADAEQTDRQRLLQLTMDDPAALEAYNDWLVSISDFSQSNRCLHGRGYCQSCQAQDDQVQAAWTAYQRRIHALLQTQNPNKGESP